MRERTHAERLWCCMRERGMLHKLLMGFECAAYACDGCGSSSAECGDGRLGLKYGDAGTRAGYRAAWLNERLTEPC